jgi:hypothetical protein
MKLRKNLASLIFSGISVISTITQANHYPDHVNGVVGTIGSGGNNDGSSTIDPSNGRLNHNRTERLVLHLGNQIYQGPNNILHLRAELMRQFPGIRTEEYALDSVKLFAKSQFGRGEADLLINQRSQGRIGIGGDPRNFFIDDVYTFDQVDLINYDRNSYGAWQILLNGNIKINSAVLSLIRLNVYPGPGPRPGPFPPQPYPVQFTDLNCSSIGYRYAACLVNGNALRVTLSSQISRSACIQGNSFGLLPNGVWVDKGCRANFRVEFR